MIERRLILQMLCALGATGIAPVAGATSALADGLDAPAIHRLASQFRATNPDRRSLASVTSLLREHATDPVRLERLLRVSMHADYRDARTVQLSGWFISRTEACLIAALSQSMQSGNS